MIDTHTIDRFILRSVAEHPKDLVTHTARRFGLSRQGAYRHVRRLVGAGLLRAQGQTRAREYALPLLVDMALDLPVDPTVQEDVVWREAVLPEIGPLGENSRRILQYGFTEILNNAVVHSEGHAIFVGVRQTPIQVEFEIRDDGVGIFRKLQRDLGLEDERHSILELSKGKLTTDPSRHTGEGIFFTSRAVDSFSIASLDLELVHDAIRGDWLIDTMDFGPGTQVNMQIDVETGRTLKEVFDRFASSEEDYGFTRTRVPVSLARYGDENLVSRSQAKRLLARFDRFQEVILDFEKVSTIGQAFADEIFRVFATEHPEVHIRWTRANAEVDAMIRRARRAGGAVTGDEQRG
ncbi:MAG: STAS-like domain-containing protein [Gemmatimonadota bacterium]